MCPHLCCTGFACTSSGLSYAEGPGLIAARDDQPSRFTVFCKDENGNPVAGEDSLDVVVENVATHVVATSHWVDKNDGSYAVEYSAKVPGKYLIRVQIDGKLIRDMPVTVLVSSGAELDALMHAIDKSRSNLGLGKREYSDEELADPNVTSNLTNEKDKMQGVEKLVAEIQKLRKELGLPPRIFTEEELIGPNAVDDRTLERDDLLEQLRKMQNTAPVVAEIQRLRKELGLSPRVFTPEELQDYEGRVGERDGLRGLTALVAEIQKLRKQMNLPPRKFTPEELSAPEAFESLSSERDHLKWMIPIHDEIHSLRGELEMPKRVFTEDDLTGSDSLPERTKERDELREMLRRKRECEPICADIDRLRQDLDMPKRKFAFEELTGPTAVKDRTEERDALQGKYMQKRVVDPLIAEIQKLRGELDLPRRQFTEDEIWGPTAIADRRKERDDLKTIIPLVDQIADLRNQLDMSKRVYEDAELDGETAIPERIKERDELLDKLGEKLQIDPLIKEIQELRAKMDLLPRVFTEKELSGPTAVRDRMKERDDLRNMLPLYDAIHDLRKQLEYPRRIFDEEELTGPSSYPDRVDEHDDLLNRLERKKITDPLCKEINTLRQDLDLPKRDFTEEERTGKTAVPDRRAELAQLKEVKPLCEEITGLRKQLEMDPRDFEEAEITGPQAVGDRTDERNDLLDKLSRLRQTEPLCNEIQRLRSALEMSPREFEPEEKIGVTAVADRTQERDDLKEMVPIVDDIHRLRRGMEMPPRNFDDSELYGPTCLPDRREERDNLKSQLAQKTSIDPIIAEIQKVGKFL